MTEQWVPFEIETTFPMWAGRAAQSMEAGLRATAPVGRGPTGGRFADSIDAHPVEGFHGVEAEGDYVPGHFLVTGTAAHLIEGNPLHWEDASGDRFARFVHHPGTQPSDFIERAIDAHEEEWSEDLMNAIAAEWAAGG